MTCAEKIAPSDSVLECLEVLGHFSSRHLEALGSTARDHSLVEVDPERLDALVSQKLQELAPPAPGIEHRLPPARMST